MTTRVLAGKRERSVRLWVRSHVPELVGTPLLVIAVIVLWGLAVQVFEVRSDIVPGPLDVGRSLVAGLDPASPQNLYGDILVTLQEVVAGFALGTAVGIALALSQLRMLERVVNPLVVAFQSMPKIGFAPLFVIWFGFDSPSKIAMVTLTVFFPVLVAGMVGFKSVDQERLEVMQSFGASKWRTFIKLVFPSALPFLFAGLEIALVQAMIAAVVSEFIAGTAGLGVLIVQMGQVLNTAGVFAVMIVLGLIGWALVLILAAVRRRLLFWSIDNRRLET
jgi:NitT/TauT family transport system permease protein